MAHLCVFWYCWLWCGSQREGWGRNNWLDPSRHPVCSLKLRGSRRVNNRRSHRHDLLLLSQYGPTDWNLDAAKDTFCQRLHGLLGTTKRGDIVILVDGVNARVGRLSSNETHIKGPFGLHSCHSENKKRSLALVLDHHLFFASRSQQWAQIDHNH